MNPEQITGSVYASLGKNGCRGRVVSVEHMMDLKKEFEHHRSRGALDEALYQAYLAGFEFGIPEGFPNAGSLVITSAPQPQRRVSFDFKGRSYPCNHTPDLFPQDG